MKKRSPIHAYKRLLARDQDWDYAFLIALEKKKLQRMHDYFKYQGHPEVNRMAPRDIAICELCQLELDEDDDIDYTHDDIIFCCNEENLKSNSFDGLKQIRLWQGKYTPLKSWRR